MPPERYNTTLAARRARSTHARTPESEDPGGYFSLPPATHAALVAPPSPSPAAAVLSEEYSDHGLGLDALLDGAGTADAADVVDDFRRNLPAGQVAGADNDSSAILAAAEAGRLGAREQRDMEEARLQLVPSYRFVADVASAANISMDELVNRWVRHLLLDVLTDPAGNDDDTDHAELRSLATDLGGDSQGGADRVTSRIERDTVVGRDCQSDYPVM